ncbi:DNRLRE domain-containing protein [Aeromicrobium sp. UC242_57]|uniref:DNRLRE domain-containing protein n=1 Tax=Aeromicrobium sp. UC242_57 TaxID=3374624 RepID=UPI0037BEC205
MTVAVSDSDDDGTLDAGTTKAAVAAAVDQGERVEDLSQRTESVSVYANPDRTFTQRDFGGTARIKQSGEWVPVDYTLVKQADGTYAPKASDLDITVDGGSAKEAARVTRPDGTSLAFTWPTNLPEPTVDGGVATYEISDSTDLLVTVTGSGVTARIRLNEQPDEDDPVFRLGLRADGVDVDQTSAGGLKITDENGKTVGSTTQLSAWDAVKDAAGDPANMVDLDAELDTTATDGDLTQHTLDLTTPTGYLTDSGTQYPVIIDPDITMEKTRDTWVRNGDTAKGSDYRLIVGKVDPAISPGNSNPARSYLKFFNNLVDSNVNTEIISAELGLWQYYGYTCNNRTMNINPVTIGWKDTITWSTRPGSQTSGSTSIVANRGASGCADGWTKVNLTNMAKAWNNGTINMEGIALVAGDETIHSAERRFCSMNPDSSSTCTAARRPYLDVTYEIEPGLPAMTAYGIDEYELEDMQAAAVDEGITLASAIAKYGWQNGFAQTASQVSQSYPEYFSRAEVEEGGSQGAVIHMTTSTPASIQLQVDGLTSGVSVPVRHGR